VVSRLLCHEKQPTKDWLGEESNLYCLHNNYITHGSHYNIHDNVYFNCRSSRFSRSRMHWQAYRVGTTVSHNAEFHKTLDRNVDPVKASRLRPQTVIRVGSSVLTLSGMLLETGGPLDQAFLGTVTRFTRGCPTASPLAVYPGTQLRFSLSWLQLIISK